MSTRHIAAMLLLMLLIPCVSHAGLFSSKKNLIEGDWYRGTGIQPTKPMLHFENGVITVWANGRVFGTYEFIGGNRVRFKRTVQDFETITIADDKGNDQEFEMPTVSRVDVIIFF